MVSCGGVGGGCGGGGRACIGGTGNTLGYGSGGRGWGGEMEYIPQCRMEGEDGWTGTVLLEDQ